MIKELQRVAISLNLITIEDIRQYTVLELIMMIASKLNEVITTVNQLSDIDANLYLHAYQILTEWSKDGSLTDLLNESLLTDTQDQINQVIQMINQTQGLITNLNQAKLDKTGKIDTTQLTGKIKSNQLSEEVLQQIAGTTPIYAVPEDNSITPEKNAYPTLIGEYQEENLLNINKLTYGGYINYETGKAEVLEGYYYTEYIPVINGIIVQSNWHEQTAFYDENKNYISGQVGIGNGGQTVPDNARYLRMSVKADQIGNAYITQMKAPLFNYHCEPRLTGKKVLGQINLIPSGESRIKIINGIATFVNFTLFEYKNKYYLNLSGSYSLSLGNMLILNPVNGDIKVCDFHSSYLNYTENYIPLLIAHMGIYTSPILEDYQIINLDYEREITVSYNKKANYTTITEAINDIKTVSKTYTDRTHYIIHIKNGAYNESLDLTGVNHISLIGESREKTVIYNHNANYYKAPLSTNGGGNFENLTFLSTSEQADVGSIPSYAMHYEGDPEMEGLKPCVFRNCCFQSDNNSAVGVGMRNNESLIFDHCEFIKTSAQPYLSGAVYCHSSQYNGHSNQSITFINCIITSDNEFTFTIDDSNSLAGIGEMGNTGGEMTLTFINTNAYCTTGCGDETVWLRGGNTLEGCFIGSIVLHNRSHGNNIKCLNGVK